MEIKELTKENFNEKSLDSFIRHQIVTDCWRCIDGKWQLIPVPFVEDWNQQELRNNAIEIVENLETNRIGYGAFEGDAVVGYITIATDLFGSEQQYVQLIEFEISEPYRGQKIGKKLFKLACNAAKELNAQKLYISAHSSKESQAAYKALGCTHATEINEILAAAEPCDVQMEYLL